MRDLEEQLDLFVDRCESAWRDSDDVDVAELLPPEDHPAFADIAVELLRIDLDHRRARGKDVSLESYVERFSKALEQREHLALLAFEDYRLRLQAGENIQPAQYSCRFDVATDTWPDMAAVSTKRASGDSEVAGNVMSDSRLCAGSTYGDFTLERELGRGALGRVFLARESGVANRRVVLKFTAVKTVEIERLGRLQHSNIVPILSAHAYEAGAALCMPFLGTATFADLLASRQQSGSQSLDGAVAEIPTAIEKTIANDGYSNFVLVSALQLAAALQHAHERDVLHGDVKLANILLATDGRVMLLDFNLAGDLRDSHPEIVGGTLRYMPPEYRAAFETGDHTVCPQVTDDIYSLGVVMLEALTGSVDPADASTQQRLRESVSPAFAAILNKCVEPDSASRYPSAAELLADLECQANHRPLIHQPEPSMKERLAKWVKRHPRLSSSGTLFTLFALILATGAAGWVSRSRQLAGYAAEAKFDSFEEAVPKACSLLTVYRDDGGSVEEGLERISTLLKSVGTDGRYRVDSLLDDTNQRQQRNRIGQLLYYEARGHALLSKMTTNAAERESELQVARAKNQDATVWFKSEVGRVPAALRAQAARFEGDPMPDAPREPADGFPLDRLLYANELIAARRFEAAWRYLDRVKSDFADDVSFWMLLGSSYAAGSKFEKADTCLTASLALNPTSWVALSDRGLARMALRQFEDAEQDFSQVVKLRPKYWGGYLNRALARAGQRKFQGAVDDLSLVIEFNGPTRAIFLRSRYRSVLGDKEGATADRQLGLTTIPSDEKSWVSRGLAVMRQDPKKALSDFREAIALNPLSVNGWRNVAHVLSERLSDSQGAIEALNKIIESGFDDAGAFAGRAVLYARDGRENEAVEDIGKALSLDSEPMTKYQAACVYALLSKEKPSHRKRSVSLLAASIPQLPRVLLQLAPRDPDLANVRNDENYRQLMESSRQLFQLQKR